jgi:hypothetical protein
VISAFLIAAQRTDPLFGDISGAGAYRISIAADAASLGSAILLGQFAAVGNQAAWEGRSFSFTAPPSADLLPLLVFTPYASGRTPAYPGIDLVSLEAVGPIPEPGTVLLVIAGASLLMACPLRSKMNRS